MVFSETGSGPLRGGFGSESEEEAPAPGLGLAVSGERSGVLQGFATLGNPVRRPRLSLPGMGDDRFGTVSDRGDPTV